MKAFTLYYGAKGQMGTSDITDDASFKLVVNTVTQLRNHLLNNEHLRAPFLRLFKDVYKDDNPFPEELKKCTPAADQIPNIYNIQQIRNQAPTDNDVIDFLTNAFPDLYLFPGEFGPDNFVWSGRGEANEQMFSINVQLVRLWLKEERSTLWFIFIALFLHELAHNALVWYAKGACDSPRLGEINGEAGNFIEKAIFGGMSCGEFQTEPMELKKIGLMLEGEFYPIDDGQAIELTKLEMPNGRPIFDISKLVPAGPVGFGSFRAKFSNKLVATLAAKPTKLAGTRIIPFLRNDKIRIMPKDG